MEGYMAALYVTFLFTFVILLFFYLFLLSFNYGMKARIYLLEIGHYLYLALGTIFLGLSIEFNDNPPFILGILLLVISLIFKIGSDEITKQKVLKVF